MPQRIIGAAQEREPFVGLSETENAGKILRYTLRMSASL
jgi:hypothetical protein